MQVFAKLASVDSGAGLPRLLLRCVLVGDRFECASATERPSWSARRASPHANSRILVVLFLLLIAAGITIWQLAGDASGSTGPADSRARHRRLPEPDADALRHDHPDHRLSFAVGSWWKAATGARCVTITT